MKQLSQTEYLSQSARAQSDEQSPTLLFTIPLQNIQVEIDGAYVESCVSVSPGFLVFTTDDCSFEETLNIVLVGQDSQVIESVSVFLLYGTGLFKFHSLSEPNKIRFSFFDDDLWQVEVFDAGKLVLPFVSEPAGVRRKLGLFRRFKVTPVARSR